MAEYDLNQMYADIISEEHYFQYRLSVDGIMFENDSLVAVQIEQSLFDSEPCIGSTACGTIECEIRSDASAFGRNAEIKPEFRAVSYVRKNEDGTPAVSEWKPAGVFYVDTRETVIHQYGEGVILNGFDGMMKTGRAFDTKLTFPATAEDVVTEIAEMSGLQVESNTLDFFQTSQRTIPSKPEYYTCREILGFIGAMYGGSFLMTADGKLEFMDIAEALSNMQ